MKKCLYICLLAVMSWAGYSLQPISAQADSVLVYLTLEDCAKCHEQEIREIESRGGKHKTAVTCLDCHLEHPPRGKEAIPACSMCHKPSENTHFALEECLGCHPVHHPMDIDFAKAGRVYPACASCHPHQSRQLEDYPSNHSLLDCKECHQKHGQFLKCQECHAPHIPEMVYEDCIGCHQPHMPLKVTYDTFVPNRFCSGCHAVEYADLEENTTKHHYLLCVYCHKDQHKRIPMCATCHRVPHASAMHEMFPACNDCHGGPHTLH